jgi:hypothetical protein
MKNFFLQKKKSKIAALIKDKEISLERKTEIYSKKK